MTPQEALKKQIATLEALTQLDKELARLDKEIAAGKGGISTMESELKELGTRLVSEKASFEDLTKQISMLHQDLRQMKEQHERSRDKLRMTRNERESMAVERELDELRRLVRDREGEIQKLEPFSAAAKKSIADIDAQQQKITGELASSGASTTARLAETEAERAAKQAERDALAKTLPGMLLKRYEAALKRRGSGTAIIEGAMCHACHVSVSPQLFQRIQRGELLEPCPSCTRLLIFRMPETAIDPTTGEAASGETSP